MMRIIGIDPGCAIKGMRHLDYNGNCFKTAALRFNLRRRRECRCSSGKAFADGLTGK